MLAWVFVVAMVGLFGVLLRMWAAFAKWERQVVAKQQSARGLTEDHMQVTESFRASSSKAEEETEAVREELRDLEQRVLQCREQLAELEQKDARRSPTRHRVDIDSEDDSA